MAVTGDADHRSTTSRSERKAAGRGVRTRLPRSAHEVCLRSDDVDAVGLLVAQDETRVKEMVPIRHGRMSTTPFRFFRGAAAIMAADLASEPHSGLEVQLCGDAHIGNFGLFYSADRRLVFDVNDFDETLPGPFEFDVKRMATSVFIAARSGGSTGSTARGLARQSVRAYRDTMAKLADIDPLSLHYLRIEVDAVRQRRLLSKRQGKELNRLVDKASTKTSFRAFGKLATTVDGRPKLVDSPPLIVRLDSEHLSLELDFIQRAIDAYQQSLPTEPRRLLSDNYRLVDAVVKVVGVGSVGNRCLIALLMSADGDPLVLQVKEASPSVLESWLRPSEHGNAGERVVRGQGRIQSAPDIFLGWTRIEREGAAHDFYIRQLWDGKASPSVDTMSADELSVYGQACGTCLALAHARTGNAAAISGYMGRRSDRFPDAVARFAEAYHLLNEADAAEHRARIDNGSLEAVFDV